MKAAVFYGPQEIRIQQVETPTIAQDEVLVRIVLTSVCGTDVRIYDGKKTKGVRTPSILGHEVVGVVEKVGDRVTDFLPGDRVGVIPVIPCRKCTYCLNGRENACANRQAIGYEFDGGFAQYIRIPAVALDAGNLVKLPNSLPFQHAVIAEPLACCINGSRKANVRMAQTVVIVGAGPIGLMHLQLAKIAGAKSVVVSELLGQRRDMALLLGADRVVNPEQESLEEVVMAGSSGEGADAVIMAIGVPSLVNSSARLLRKGGILNLFAGFTHGVTCEIDPNLVHYNELQVVGTSASTRQDYLTALSLIMSGKINAEAITTSGYTIDTVEQAILDVKTGAGMKSVIQM